MEFIGSLFLVLALALLVALFVAQPFLRGGAAESDSAAGEIQEHEHLRSSLLAERDRVLNALQDLDFDYALGKVPPEDYPAQRAVLLNTGADVLRRLDALEAAGSPRETATAEDRIEAAVAARRADAAQAARGSAVPAGAVAAAQAAAPAPGSARVKDELEDLIAARKRQRQERAAGFCPRCGKPVQKSDKFCSKCGATL